ncbi:McrC family protein [Bacillus cytotoxicus]|uniref:McrC family protein n=1 Tax=Bacillus cytotoxicus TaxID=580165 RepID=UPI0035CA079D
MNTITTFEYSYLTYKEILKGDSINYESLSKLNTLISDNYAHMLRTDLEGVHIKNFVGVIKLGDTLIEILPKIYNKDNTTLNNETKTEIYKNLYYMINKTLKIPNHNIDFNNYDVSKGMILDFFISLFLQNLSLKLLKGTYRTYVREEENSEFIKGKILISKNILMNPLNLKMYSEFDNYTEDNIVNQIFKYVVNDMLKNTLWPKNKVIAKQILLRLSDVTDIYINESTFTKVKHDRLLVDFENLLNFAKFYILSQSLDFSGTKESDVFIFNIDMNTVYQDYISELIKEYSSEVTSQRNVYTQKSGKHLIFDKFNNGRFNLQPDITIEKDNKIQVIIDTKYKKLLQSKPRKGVSDKDIYQMFGYYHKYQKPKIVLLYPEYEAAVSDVYTFYLESKTKLNVSTINLKGPLYTKEGERHIVEKLTEIILRE